MDTYVGSTYSTYASSRIRDWPNYSKLTMSAVMQSANPMPDDDHIKLSLKAGTSAVGGPQSYIPECAPPAKEHWLFCRPRVDVTSQVFHPSLPIVTHLSFDSPNK